MSSRYCDGLMQIEVKPRSSCFGMAASASSRSAVLAGSGNLPRTPPTSSSCFEVPSCFRHRGPQALELVRRGLPERMEAAAVPHQPS